MLFPCLINRPNSVYESDVSIRILLATLWANLVTHQSNSDQFYFNTFIYAFPTTHLLNRLGWREALYVNIECLTVVVSIWEKKQSARLSFVMYIIKKAFSFWHALFFICSKSSSHSHSKDRIINRPSPPAASSLLTSDGSYSSSFQQIMLRANPPLPIGNSKFQKPHRLVFFAGLLVSLLDLLLHIIPGGYRLSKGKNVCISGNSMRVSCKTGFPPLSDMCVATSCGIPAFKCHLDVLLDVLPIFPAKISRRKGVVCISRF